jgi:hypothetical protein
MGEEGFGVIKIIDDGKFMTCDKAMSLYRNNRILFFVTERNLEQLMADNGYVYAIGDDDTEWFEFIDTFDSSEFDGRDPKVISPFWIFGDDYDPIEFRESNRVVSVEML